MHISFNFLSKISLTKRTDLRGFIAKMFKMEKRKPGQINFVFCSDQFLLDINKAYLQHTYFTDIITFDLSVEGRNCIDGEIYISTDTVRENAGRFNNPIGKELHRVIFHGVLHLVGYDDKTLGQQQTMTEKEDFYLQLYFGLS